MILPSAIILPLPEPVNNFVDQSTNKLKNNQNYSSYKERVKHTPQSGGVNVSLTLKIQEGIQKFKKN